MDHTRGESNKARLIGGETKKEVNEPPYSVATCDVVDQEIVEPHPQASKPNP